MKNYKIIFSHNEVILCQPASTQFADNTTNVFYEHEAGKRMLIYAIVSASDEREAISEAQKLAGSYLQNSHSQGAGRQ
jgi:hypothetical protein